MFMSNPVCQPEPIDYDKEMLVYATTAYADAKQLQEEFTDIRKGFPPEIQIPAQRLSLRVSRYQHRIRIRWYYRDRMGKNRVLVRVCCYKTKSGRPYLKYDSRTFDLHIGGAEPDVRPMIEFENRVWLLINHAEDISDICKERKISLVPAAD